MADDAGEEHLRADERDGPAGKEHADTAAAPSVPPRVDGPPRPKPGPGHDPAAFATTASADPSDDYCTHASRGSLGPSKGPASRGDVREHPAGDQRWGAEWDELGDRGPGACEDDQGGPDHLGFTLWAHAESDSDQPGEPPKLGRDVEPGGVQDWAPGLPGLGIGND